MEKEYWMSLALKEAVKARNKDEVPIGCIIVKDDKVLARAHNLKIHKKDSTCHAEVECIRKACKKLNTWRLEECDLYVTLEPCPMCAGAIIQSRIRNVYYGASDFKGGSVKTCIQLFDIKQYNHHPSYVSGICEQECAQLLKTFFKNKRNKNKS